MIKFPEKFLTKEELEKAAEKKAEDINVEITDIFIDKNTFCLNMNIKLNFTMPKSFEELIKERIASKISNIKNVKINYEYSGVKIIEYKEEPAKKWEYWKGKKSKKDEQAFVNANNELVLLGKDFNGNPISYEEAVEYVGEKEKVVVEGDIFNVEFKPIKKDCELVTILIANDIKTFCLKAFITKNKKIEFEEKLMKNDKVKKDLHVKAKGLMEFDTFVHENVLKFSNLKLVKKELKKDSYEGTKRVELHCHSKMSDNDGFNEIADIVKMAAAWGQPAVAITDHGVVQAFPDAAAEASKLEKNGTKIKVIYGLEGYLYPDEDSIDENGEIDVKKNGTYHIILLAKNQTGIKNLYKLVSKSHIDFFYKRPRIPRTVLEEHRDGLIVGSACEAGELYRAIVAGKNEEELLKIADYYDYLEIQPIGNNAFMVNDGIVSSVDELKDINKKIVEIGDKLGKITVATTDAHFPNKESSIFREIILSGIGFDDPGSNDLYLRTTDEMMKEFEYLGDRAEEVVITNTNKVSEMIDDGILPVPKEKFPPKIEGADDTLRKSCYEKAKSIYGNPLPPDIKDRLETELSSIIGNGYAVMYIAAQLLVNKSLEDGYLVGSRGSVGSSFAATMAGITEVNPLPPHYICPKCKTYLKPENDDYDTGYDMPEKNCPRCGERMNKEGLNIPFATFLGFKGDKEPDIDLNFAGEYQATAHKYVGEIFGENNVYKAGTVATVEDRTAFGYVKHYIDEKNMNLSRYDIEYLVKGCTGVKRTTGQHPGGIIVVPDDHEIYEFCPIQKPANKRDVDVITTHFDYHKIDSNLLKLDILGHNGPSIIRQLQLLTDVDPLTIPMDDPKTLSIFTSLDELNIKNPNYKFVHGTYAIPEFGTNFTRGMLDDIMPTTVSALIKMSGFSHGTNVWTNNAQDLIRNKTATIDEVISCRDDIMNYLIKKGLDNGDAFRIMEIVRKNKPLTDEDLKLMKDHDVPDWYITSCETLEYMFPRAHAAAYVMNSIRMAWFKVYYPEAFYAAWFTSKVEDFDAEIVGKSIEEIEHKLEEYDKQSNELTTKENNQLTVYEVVYEMMSRGYEFREPVLGISDPCKFTLYDGKILLPFNAISGIGNTAAESLTDAFNKGDFKTIEDVKNRTKLSGTNIDDLKRHGIFEGLPESAQMTLFEI